MHQLPLVVMQLTNHEETESDKELSNTRSCGKSVNCLKCMKWYIRVSK